MYCCNNISVTDNLKKVESMGPETVQRLEYFLKTTKNLFANQISEKQLVVEINKHGQKTEVAIFESIDNIFLFFFLLKEIIISLD